MQNLIYAETNAEKKELKEDLKFENIKITYNFVTLIDTERTVKITDSKQKAIS